MEEKFHGKKDRRGVPFSATMNTLDLYFRQVLPEVIRGGATFLILPEDRIVLVAAPPRKIENRW